MTLGDFSEQAAAYERARPGYPEVLLAVLVEEAAIRPGDAVVEFGAGTGIFTRMLVLDDPVVPQHTERAVRFQNAPSLWQGDRRIGPRRGLRRDGPALRLVGQSRDASSKSGTCRPIASVDFSLDQTT